MTKDESFDRLLDRTARTDEARTIDGCLDAETLAAFADGVLPAAERAAAEAHAADCDRCLAVLAAIARTAPPPSVSERPAWYSLRWLVPLTTAAVAITVWVLVQTPSSPIRSDAAQAPPIDSIAPAAPPAETERDASLQARKEDSLEKKEAASARRQAASNESRARESAQNRLATADRVDSPARTPVPNAPASRPPAAAAPTQADKPAAAAEAVLVRPFAAAQQISSPDPASRWRLVNQSVERSTDGGRTWRGQTTGTTTDLLAGASPARTVCWIVGRGGLVLLTTDGETWTRIDFPDTSIDLLSVTATDAATATVTAGNGRSYRTTDAGRTWTLQETQAAPF